MENMFPHETNENFHERPVRLPILGTTGLPKGDDNGYRDVAVEESGERMVVLGNYVMTRPFYDGVSPYTGEPDQSLTLPGGTGEIMYARESVAIGAAKASEYLRETYGDDVDYGVIDAFCSGKRQAADFTRQLIIELGGDTSPDPKKLFETGVRTNGTVSWVNPMVDSAVFEAALSEVLADRQIMEALDEAVQALYEKKRALDEKFKRKAAAKEIATMFVTICANVEAVRDFFGYRAPKLPIEAKMPLYYQNNAHAGGGALDGFIFIDGVLVSNIPYNYVGPEAARNFTEHDENFEGFCAKVKQDSLLRIHMERMGINPDEITRDEWQLWRQVQRIRHGVMDAMGATFYSSSDPAPSNPYNYKKPVEGGEIWHDEFGNIITDPATGEIVHRGGLANKYPQSGNPGHALQTMGRGRAVAVWGGIGAHKQLADMGVLDMELADEA